MSQVILPPSATGGGLTDAELRATAVPVDSELTTADHDTGGGTDTRAVVGVVIPGSGGGVLLAQPLTDTQLRATPVPVSGTVTANVGTGTQPVSGTVTANAGTGPFPVSDNGGTLTVDGPVTDTQLRASPVPVEQATSVDVADGGGSLTVDGSVTADTELPTAAALADNTSNPTVPGTGAFAMVWDGSNWDRANQPLTDTQLRATAVTVDTELPAGLIKNADNGLEVHVNNGTGGGGTEYTEGDTDASITGQAILWEDGSDTLRAVSTTKPLPVEQNSSVVVDDGGGSLTVDGTVGVSGTVSVEQATSVDVADGGGSLTVDGPVTDTQLRATPVPVEQATTVDIADGGGSITVDGPVTDTQLRASPVPVEQATSVDIADGGGSITVDGPVTDTQLRATPIPVEQATSVDVADGGGSLTVDGTVTANAGTGPFPVSDNGGSLTVDGTVTADAAADVTATGLMDALNEAVTLTVPAGCNSFGIVVTGTFDLASRLAVEGTVDGTTWDLLPTQYQGTVSYAPQALITGLDITFGNNNFVSPTAGMQQVRVRISTFTAADSVTATLRARIGSGAVNVLNPVTAAGDVVHDFANSTNVVQVGGHANDAKPTAVAAADRVRAWYGLSGGQMTHLQPHRRAEHQVVTGEVAPAITIGVKELFNFFSPAAVTVDVYILEIVVSVLVTTASTTGGRTNVEVVHTTTVGTGGTNVTSADIGGAGTSAVAANSAANLMQAKTGGGTLTTTFMRQGVEHATQPLGSDRFTLFSATNPADAIVMRAGVGRGINVQVNRVVAHTALVDQWTCSVRWIEL